MNELSDVLKSCLCGIARKINNNNLESKYKNNTLYINVIDVLRLYLYDDAIKIILMYYEKIYKFKTIHIGNLGFIQSENEKICINYLGQYDYTNAMTFFETFVYESNNDIFLRKNMSKKINFYLNTDDLPKKIIRYHDILYILNKTYVSIIKDYHNIEVPSFYSIDEIFTFKIYEEKLYYSTRNKIFEYSQGRSDVFYETSFFF